MCKLRINTSYSVPLPLCVLKQPDSTQEASRKPPSFILLISQGVVMPALPFANEPALSDHLYWSAVMPWTSLIDISIPPASAYIVENLEVGWIENKHTSRDLRCASKHSNYVY